MTLLQADTVANALVQKGMERDESHHHMFRKQVEGVTKLVTRMSHNSGAIDDGIAKLMANQLCLQLAEFKKLVECPLTEEEWDCIVAERCPDGRNPFLGR